MIYYKEGLVLVCHKKRSINNSTVPSLHHEEVRTVVNRFMNTSNMIKLESPSFQTEITWFTWTRTRGSVVE